jgi:hypothetical protein
MRFLHLVARISVFARSPKRAHEVVSWLGRRLEPVDGIDEARRELERLESRGTCLTRAMAVASRLPGASVVIGVDPRRAGRMASHAWIEWRGTILAPPSEGIEEIARFS